MDLEKLERRKEVPIYTKMKCNPEHSQLVNNARQKDYDYYICDYCGAEIRILKEFYKQTGGTVELPYTITKTKKVKLALCNKCYNPAVKEFETRVI